MTEASAIRHNPRFAISTFLWYSEDAGSGIARLAELGFREVEVFGNERHYHYTDKKYLKMLEQLFADTGMRAVSLHGPMYLGKNQQINLSHPDEAVRKTSVQETLKVIEAFSPMASERRVTLHPSAIYTGDLPLMQDQQHDQLCKSVVELLDATKKENWLFNVENMPPGYFGSSIQDVLRVIEKVGRHDRLGMLLDTGHMLLTGRQPYAVLAEIRDYVRVVHMSDNIGDGDAHLLPRKGKIDWDMFLASLVTQRLEPLLIFEINGIENMPALPGLAEDFNIAIEQAAG